MGAIWTCYNGWYEMPFMWKENPQMKFRRSIALALALLMLFATPAMAISRTRARQVLSVAFEQLGKPYELISDAPNSFNCASFVAYCFNAVDSGSFTNNRFSGHYRKISSMKKLKAGDIVCFKASGSETGMLSYHFGIYMGKGHFIHASNSAKEVIISKLTSYSGRFLGGLRIS